MTRSLEDFATKHNLVLAEDRNDFLERLGKRSRHIVGRNGSVIESSTPGRLLVSIVYLSGWERAKLEFRLACRHIRVLPDRCSDGALCAEFSADNERQSQLVIELAQLKEMNHLHNTTVRPFEPEEESESESNRLRKNSVSRRGCFVIIRSR